mgnify:CR=1 FL=1
MFMHPPHHAMPPQKKKLFLAQFLLFFRTFFGGRTRSGVFPPRCPLQKSFLFLTQLLLFFALFFFGTNFRRATCAAEEGLIRRRRKLLFNLLADLRLLGMFTALGLLRWTFVLGLPGSTGFLRGKGGGGSAMPQSLGGDKDQTNIESG